MRHQIGDEVMLGEAIRRAYPRVVWEAWSGVVRVAELLPDGVAVANASGATLAKIPHALLTPVRSAEHEVEWAERGAPAPDLTSSVQAIP